MEQRKQKSHLTKTPPRKWRQKVMSTSIAARMLQLLGLLTLFHQHGVCTNLEVTMMYTQVGVMGPLFVTTELGNRPLGFLKPTLY